MQQCSRTINQSTDLKTQRSHLSLWSLNYFYIFIVDCLTYISFMVQNNIFKIHLPSQLIAFSLRPLPGAGLLPFTSRGRFAPIYFPGQVCSHLLPEAGLLPFTSRGRFVPIYFPRQVCSHLLPGAGLLPFTLRGRVAPIYFPG